MDAVISTEGHLRGRVYMRYGLVQLFDILKG